MKLPKALVKAAHEGKLILFVGNGLSRHATNNQMPTWANFISQLGNDVPLSPARQAELTSAPVYIGADYVSRKLGRRLKGSIAGVIAAAPPDLKKIGPLHDLPFKFIITTNFDSFIEDSEPLAGAWVKPGVRLSSLPVHGPKHTKKVLHSIRSGKSRFIFKIHGDPKIGNIVLSLGSYYKLLSNPDYTALMHAIFCNYVVLFLGFGLDDYDFNNFYPAVARLLEGSSEKHYALVRGANSITASTYKRYGIQIISGDFDKFFRMIHTLKPIAPILELNFKGLGQGPRQPVRAGAIVAPNWVVYHQGFGLAAIEEECLHLRRAEKSPRALSVRYMVVPITITETTRIDIEIRVRGEFEFFVLLRKGEAVKYVAITTEAQKEEGPNRADLEYFFLKPQAVERRANQEFNIFTLRLNDNRLSIEFRGFDQIVGFFVGVNNEAWIRRVVVTHD